MISCRSVLPKLLLVVPSVLAIPRTELGDTLFATHLTPARAAAAICIDTPLYITFDQAPLKGSGLVRILRADGTLVDSVDVGRNTEMKTVGGSAPLNYYPVVITGNTAAIYLHRALEYNQAYHVLVDSGAFVDAQRRSFGISDPDTWRFSTRTSGPPLGATELTVAADGTGDFCTVQGAVDFVPINNTQRVNITVARGTYTELVYVRSNKPFITVSGEDRAETVVEYPNNDRLNPGTAARPMFRVDASDFILENITLHNTTPYGGSQAEALRLNNQRMLVNRVNLKSFQDTFLQTGTAFITNSDIEGDVDFMWGYGAAYFQNCELRAVTAGAYYTQIRNNQGQYGNVFVNCRLTRSDESVTGAYLSRIAPDVFPYSQVVYIGSAMDAHILPQGWLLNTTPPNDCSQAPQIQFWEYRSTDLNGRLLDVGQRLACSRQLSDEEAARWSDPAFVLNGWVPNTVNATPASVSPGESIIVNWSAPRGHSARDWIGLYETGAADSAYMDRQYAGAGSTGNAAFVAPSGHGQYEFRYFPEDAFTRAAISNRVVVQERRSAGTK